MLKKPSIKEDRRLEILGILLMTISVFVMVSLLGWDPSEDWSKLGPLVTPNGEIKNPMGQLGVFVSWVLIKKGFGFSSLILPTLGVFWGWVFFSKKGADHPTKVTLYSLALMLLLSISIGIISFQITPQITYRCSCNIISRFISPRFMCIRSYVNLSQNRHINILRGKT